MTKVAGLAPRRTRLHTSIAFLLAFAVFASAFAGALAAPRSTGGAFAPAAITASQYCPDSEERAFLKLINDYRRQNGLGALTLTKTLGAAAEHHSRDMAAKNYFSHTLSGGVTWSQNIKNHGYTYNTYRGENIAAGNSGAQNTFNQWKNSAGHRANMLNSNFNAIGIGRAYNANATYKWYWTTTFGGHRDAAVSC